MNNKIKRKIFKDDYFVWNLDEIKIVKNLKGGRGSGNFQHQGRIGKIGGSASRLNSQYQQFAQLHNSKSYEVGSIFDDDGNEIVKKVTDLDSNDLTITMDNSTELMLKGKNFVHNHPEGSSLSDGDVDFAIAWGLHSITATSEDGIYTMRFDNVNVNNRLTYKKAVRAIEQQVYSELFAKLNSEKITIAEAEKMHFDLVWRKFEDKFSSHGFTYTHTPFRGSAK